MDIFSIPKMIQYLILFIVGLFIFYCIHGDGIYLIYWGVLRLFGKKITYEEAADKLGDFLFGWFIKRKNKDK